MAAEEGVDLLCGNEKEVLVRETAGSLEVDLLLQ
jgi:hypothetical protein